MRCFKLLGERVMAHAFDHQVAELQVRSRVLNRLLDWVFRLRSRFRKTGYTPSAHPLLDLPNKADMIYTRQPSTAELVSECQT